MATFSMGGVAAEAATIVQTVEVAPTGPGSPFVVRVSDTDLTANVAMFHQRVYFNENQVDIGQISAAALRMIATGTSIDADISAPKVADAEYTLSGYTHYVTVFATAGVALESAFTLGAGGALYELDLVTAAGYTGIIELAILPSEPEFYGADDYVTSDLLDLNVTYLANNNPAYSQPVLTSVVPNYYRIGAPAISNVQLHGANFYNGPAPAPHSSVLAHGPASGHSKVIDPTYVSTTQLTVPTSPADLSNFNTPAPIDVINLMVDNGAGHGVSNVVPFFIISTDEVWVDKDWAGTSTGTDVSGDDSGWIYGVNAFSTIQAGVNAASVSGKVNVLDSAIAYAELVTINKANLEIAAVDGAVITGPASAPGSSKLITVNAEGVEIRGLGFDMNAHAGIGVFAEGRNSLTVEDCHFEVTEPGGTSPGTVAGTWGPKGIFFKGANPTNSVVTLKSNTFECPDYTYSERFSYAMHVEMANAQIGGAPGEGNISSGAYRDLSIRYSRGIVQNNRFALNAHAMNAAGLLTIRDNTFANDNTLNAGTPVIAQHEEAALSIQANNAGHPIEVLDNVFLNSARGIWSGGSNQVTITGNSFTPADFVHVEDGTLSVLQGGVFEPDTDTIAQPYAHIIVDSSHLGSAPPTIGAANNAIIKGNIFNSSANPQGGMAINFRDPFDGDFTGLEIGAAGEANIFDSGLQEYIRMADDFSIDVNVVHNQYAGVLGSAVNETQGWAIEDKIFHKIDDNNLGFARVRPGNVYVTPNGKIQNAINAADGGTLVPDVQGDTVHVQNGQYAESNINVHKRVALLGESEAGTLVLPEAAGDYHTNLFDGNYQHGFIISADKVTIEQFTLDGINPALSSDPYMRAGVVINEPLGSFGGVQVTNVTVKNTLRTGVALRTAINPALGDPTLVNLVEDCHFDSIANYYAVYVYNGNTNIYNNTFTNTAGVLANGTSAQAPVVAVKGNTIANTTRNGIYLTGVAGGSIIGGPNPADRNFLNYIDGSSDASRALTVNYARGQITVQNNKVYLDNADTGLRMYNNNHADKPVLVYDNEFRTVNSVQPERSDGTAIFMTNLGRPFFNDGDRGHSYAVIQGNLIDGFVTGIDMFRGSVDETSVPKNHVVEATIGGTDAGESNDIANCGTGILVSEDHIDYPGYRTTAQIVGNNTTISGSEIAIDVDGGVAVITGNTIEDNETGIQVRNTGIATIGNEANTDPALANTMVGNGKHFSFQSASSGLATVNGFDAFDRDVADMLGVVDANAVTGKTYITETMIVPGTTLVEESGFVNLRSQINPAVQVAEAEGNTVNVGEDPVAYVENIIINKQLLLNGAGIDQAVISAANGGASHAAIRCMTAAGVIIQGFTITREGNNLAEWASNPVTAGIAVQGSAGNLTVRNNKLTGNRTGIDINKSSGNVVMNNIIDFNRTGMILRNECPNNVITGNFITNNWTKGVTWLITGLVADSTNTFFYDNEISGNWYGDIQSQGTDGGYKQFALNWFGHSGPITVDASNYTEPGYTDLIPAAFGGTDGPPAVAAPNISGAGLHLVDFTPYLNAGDQDLGTDGFQSDYSILNVTADAGQAGSVGRVAEAVQTLQDGIVAGALRQVNVWPGVYTEVNSSLSQSARVIGVGADRSDATLQPATAGSGIGLIINAHDVSIENLTLEDYAVAVQRTGDFGGTKLLGLAVNDSGHWSAPKSGAVYLGQSANAAHSAQSEVVGCTFDNNTYAALQLIGSNTRIASNKFTNMDYLGVFGIVAGSTKPVVDIDTNEFERVPAAVRLYGGDLSSEIHGNTFALGMGAPDQKVTLGVQLELGGSKVYENTFTSNGTETVGNSAYGIGGGNLGVWVWNNGSTEAQITDNVFTSTAGTRTATAIHVVGKREGDLAGSSGNDAIHGSSADIRDNTISNYKYGVRIDNANGSSQVASAELGGTAGVGGNDISGCEVGLLVEGDTASAIVQNGLAAAGFHGNDTGIEFDAASVAISQTVIDGNDTGVHISGDASSSSITDNTFTIGADAGSRYVVNTSADNLDLSSNRFAGDLASALSVNTPADLDKLWDIEDLLTHKLDNVAYGFLNVNTGNVFATHAKSIATPGVIGRGVEAASAGDTVQVQESQPGAPYVENSVNVDKHINLVSTDGKHAAEIETATGLQINLPAAGGSTLVEGFRITGTASTAMRLDGSNQVDNSTFKLSKLAFENLPFASGNVALSIRKANLVGANTSGLVQDVDVTGSADGIVITDSRDIIVEDAMISGNTGTGIRVLRTVASLDGSQDIDIVDSFITDNGVAPGLENDQAYGIVFGSDGIATLEAPFGVNNSVVNTEIRNNGGAGLVITGQNVDEDGVEYGTGTSIAYNTIEGNGVAETAVAPFDYADGIKINSSRNVGLTRNIIRENIRHGILVTGQAGESWAGDHVFAANHITKNTESGLTLQVAGYQSGDPKVVADANWWGHVYGPLSASIPELAQGRGQLFDPQQGEAVLDTWYGQRNHAERWFALNDRDGDGVYDADEDHSLDGIYQLVPTSPDTMVETNLSLVDTDNDGYEDGFEIAVGTDPNLASSTPYDLGYLVPNHLDTTDSNSNGYRDWYEIAIGDRIPKLGDVNNDGVLDAIDTALFRSVMIETTSFKASGVYQDAMDLNRDGVVTNVDTILIRRAAADIILLPFIP